MVGAGRHHGELPITRIYLYLMLSTVKVQTATETVDCQNLGRRATSTCGLFPLMFLLSVITTQLIE